MASDVTSRKTIRDRAVALLTAALVGEEKPVQTVFDHVPSELELEGQSPVIYVKSGPIERKLVAEHNTRKRTMAQLFVHVLVSNDENDGLDPDEVEDKLDEIEKGISDIRFDNQIDAGYWQFWDVAGPSVVGFVTIGKEYRTEITEHVFEFRDD